MVQFPPATHNIRHDRPLYTYAIAWASVCMDAGMIDWMHVGLADVDGKTGNTATWFGRQSTEPKFGQFNVPSRTIWFKRHSPEPPQKTGHTATGRACTFCWSQGRRGVAKDPHGRPMVILNENPQCFFVSEDSGDSE